MTGARDKHVLILGCGYTGAILAQRWTFKGQPVVGTARTETGASIVRTRGARPVIFDGTNWDALSPWRGRTRAIVHSVPPAMRSDGGYDDVTAALLERVAGWGIDKLVYLSSTSAYGDKGGAVVDERTPCAPDSPRGEARHAIEQQVLGSGLPACVVRIAGIYGPGRSQLHRLAAGKYRLVAGGGAYTNRIHVTDLAAIIERAVERGQPGATFLASDTRPATQREVVDHIVATYGLPEPADLPLAEARVRLSKDVLKMITGSKRLDSAWTREQLGVTLRHPTFVEGLADIWRRERGQIEALAAG